ncbi:MAG: amidohydrolase family protein [Deltaproteobacteria bacterium]|nr:amidohydrolase family protein [Deltaproteobacteria bacterium]
MVTDLGGRTVIPGLIDNHVHYLRGVPYWRWEVLFDAVNTRKRALELIAEKVLSSKPGEWVLSVGGWTPGQFTDSTQRFTREELDRLAPNNPVFIQFGFRGGVGNSLALKAVGMENSSSGFIGSVGRFAGFPEVVRKALPRITEESYKNEYLKKNNEDYNRAGITALWEAGAIHYPNRFTEWVQEYVEENGGWSNLRIFHHFKSDARTPEQADRIMKAVRDSPPLEKGDYFRIQGFGEIPYIPTYDVLEPWGPNEEQFGVYRKILETIVEKRWQVSEHVMQTKKFDPVLDIWEEIDKKYDIKPLRWTFHHCYGMKKEHLERAAKLNMFAAMQISPAMTRGGVARYFSSNSPPFRTAQESGIKWGLGTDAKIVSPYPAFFTLYFAVTGRDVAGNVINPEQTVSRKDALIAHTRSNAWYLFMEDDLGSIEPGKYADIVVLDRDYMTCPDKEIRDIESILTIVGGRVGYEAK